jgi:hypothetical protein
MLLPQDSTSTRQLPSHGSEAPYLFFEIGSIFIANDRIENHIQHENRHKLPLPPLALIEIFECDCQNPKNLLNSTNRQKSIKKAIEKRNEEASTTRVSV